MVWKRCHKLFTVVDDEWRDSGNTNCAICQRFKVPLSINMWPSCWLRRYKSLEDQRDRLCHCGSMPLRLVRMASHWYHIWSRSSHWNLDYHNICPLNLALRKCDSLHGDGHWDKWSPNVALLQLFLRLMDVFREILIIKCQILGGAGRDRGNHLVGVDFEVMYCRLCFPLKVKLQRFNASTGT